MKWHRRRWWLPPADDLSRALAFGGMPASLPGFVRRVSAWSQLWLSLLAIGVFVLNTVPLELQRRILNAMVVDGDFARVLGLTAVYAGVVLAEGLLKLLMNVYRGWVAEKAVRALRLSTTALVESLKDRRGSAGVQGVGIALILDEPEPIGGFVGVALSELVLQVGILVGVFGYMFYLQPLLAVVSFAMFSPQFVFVPLMQRAVNRRVAARVRVLRQTSVGVLRREVTDVERAMQQEMRFAEIFVLNLGIFKLRYSMKFLMNLTQNLGKAVVLGVGGWYVIHGQADVGMVVAFISGLNNLADPWRDLVTWYQEMMVTDAKYRVYLNAMNKFAAGEDPIAA